MYETDSVPSNEQPIPAPRQAHFVLSFATIEGTRAVHMRPRYKAAITFSLSKHQAVYSIVILNYHLLGFTVIRYKNTGTPFVRSIYEVFQKYERQVDINSLMTRVMSIL